MNVKQLLEILDSDAPDDVRAMAADGLRGTTDAGALEALTRALAEPGASVRLAAAWALSESAANLARAASDAVLDDDRLPTAHGIAMIGRLISAGEPALRRTMANADDAVARCQAAGVALGLPYAEAMRMLQEALEDEGRLGVLAASLLAPRGDDAAVDRLIASLTDPSEPIWLKWVAASSLVRIEDGDIAAVVADALNEKALVLEWAEQNPAETAELIDRAADSRWKILRDAAQAAYEVTVACIEEPPTNDQIDEGVINLTGHNRDARTLAHQQLLVLAESADILPVLRAAVDAGFDDPQVILADLADVLKTLADPASLPELRRLAMHSDWSTRCFAVEGLGRIGDHSAADVVYGALVDDDAVFVRKAAAVAVPAVAESGDGARDVLLRCVLGDPGVLSRVPDLRVVRPAGKALAILSLTDAIEPLSCGLSHEKPAVRQSAAWALGETCAAPALRSLITLLEKEEHGAVRRACAWALGELGSSEAVPVLVAALEDPDPSVQDEAALALGELRAPEAVDGLVHVFEESVPAVRARAAWALGNIRDSRAIEPLENILLADGSPQVRTRCAQALGVIGDQRSGPCIADRVIAEPDPEARGAMIHALGELAWAPAQRDLETRVLEDLAPGVRRAAAQVLGRIGDHRSAQLLDKSASSDGDFSVRDAARKAAERIRHRLDGNEGSV